MSTSSIVLSYVLKFQRKCFQLHGEKWIEYNNLNHFWYIRLHFLLPCSCHNTEFYNYPYLFLDLTLKSQAWNCKCLPLLLKKFNSFKHCSVSSWTGLRFKFKLPNAVLPLLWYQTIKNKNEAEKSYQRLFEGFILSGLLLRINFEVLSLFWRRFASLSILG